MGLQYVAIGFALLGLVMFVAGLRRLRHRHVASGCMRCLGAMLPLALAAALALVASNLYTYGRLTEEQAVATLTFDKVEPQRFRATLATPDGRQARFMLAGDEWQLDARVIKWHGFATLAGLDALYRLERLSGRYRDIRQELDDERTVIKLGGERGIDLWRVANEYPAWTPFVDARYGSATYLPMADDARYEVSITASGLIARPLDARTEAVVEAW